MYNTFGDVGKKQDNTNHLLFQKLCDMVCDFLLEESNVQPVSTPVTVCGDIHGQVSG